MKVLKSWLQDYLKIDINNNEIAERLSLSSFAVDSIETLIDNNIVVAKILSISKHANADKLRLVKIDDGEKTYKVVCGASNIKVGQMVPFARIGSKVLEHTIQETEIRGESSHGMLCSALELGIGDDHSGILILDHNLELGKPVGEVLDSDAIFDLDITPNRGDCLSHYGVARELSALYSRSIVKAPIKLNMSLKKIDDKFSLNVKDKLACPQYMARLVEGVRIAESPEWLRKRLTSVGISPINNVVDATNYILLDLGHPLHAFDADKIRGNKIIVRRATSKENIKTIDHKQRKLTTDNIVIADTKEPIAIAGIMGGSKSEITHSTTNVIIEAAEFDRRVIRKSSKALGLSTEASHRFERGIDPGGIEYALNKAANLICEIAGGKISSGILKQGEMGQYIDIGINYNGTNKLLGTNLSADDIDSILRRVGCEIVDGVAEVPRYRHDISIWQDLAEEVGRIYGYGIIGLNKIELAAAKDDNYFFKFKEFIKDIFVENEFSEALNYSFIRNEDILANNLAKSKMLRISNSCEKDDLFLRPSLIPLLLKMTSRNQSIDQISIFELGSVFSKSKEKFNLAAVCCGKDAEQILDTTQKTLFEKTGSKCSVKIFELNQKTKDILKIRKSNCFYFELCVDNLYSNSKIKKTDIKYITKFPNIKFRAVSKYPSSIRDMAFIVDKKVKTKDVEESIYSLSDYIQMVELFDEFSSDKFGKGNKNIAFHIYLQDLNSTMKFEDSEVIINDIKKTVTKKYKAKLRDF
jgi:phenylalanyl-tRNA synthetase beta chain